MPDTRKSIKKIKSGLMSRGLSLARVTATVGGKAAAFRIQKVLSDSERFKKKAEELLASQAISIVSEMEKLKGSIMKTGQILSIYGEYFFPKEVNAILKTLQKDSAPLVWSEIEKIINSRMSVDDINDLKIDQKCIGAASLGQVHRAHVNSTGMEIVLKIQYPKVKEAIDQDLKMLRSLFKVAKLFPADFSREKIDLIFGELRSLLHQEIDYKSEFLLTERYRNAISDDSRYIVPIPDSRFSSEFILATTFEDGFALDSNEVLGLSQVRKNRLAESFLDLYFREIFDFGFVQTDTHFGNYAVSLGESSDRWILFDFGAVREYPESFLLNYKKLIAAIYDNDTEALNSAAIDFGMATEVGDEIFLNHFSTVCGLLGEPFSDRKNVSAVGSRYLSAAGEYHWGNTDLPDRVIDKAKGIAKDFRFRLPPKENISLDRKISGVFMVLKKLNAEINSREILGRWVRKFKDEINSKEILTN